MKKIVTRFAPSPTGFLHIGSLRTALFSYLWAKKNKGLFRLRIEDTDQKRKVMDADAALLQTLTDLGLAPDGEIVYQSLRVQEKVYRDAALRLIDKGHAYYCFCAQERLERVRAERTARKLPPGYDGKCRSLELSEANARVRAGEPATVRLKWGDAPGKSITFNDELHGAVPFSFATLEDAVLLKSDGYPTYHLANVVDDHDMQITDVIRGEEWLPSAPIHELVYQYLGYARPKFYHIPLILNPDKSKLSKRQGHVSVESYLKLGYLKEALINYVALLGWNPGDNRELFSLNELIAAFDVAHINTSGAVFDVKKLNWFNSEYIKKFIAPKAEDELLKIIQPFMPDKDAKTILKIFSMFYERIEKLSDLATVSEFLFMLPHYEAALLVFKKSTREKTTQGLKAAKETLESLETEWTGINIEVALKEAVQRTSLAVGDIFWPVRVAVSGLSASPPPTDIIAFLGKDESLNRISHALSLMHP